MATRSIGSGKICAILLAAGAGSRFQGRREPTSTPAPHKLVAELRGRPVHHWAMDAVAAAGFDHVVVVTGPAVLDIPTSFLVVPNPTWADGQATSLQHGIAAARDLDCGAAVVGLADQPFVTADAWRRVAASSAEIAVATYPDAQGGHRRGNPVLLRRSVWDLLPTHGDHGARSLMAGRPDLVAEVACVGSPADIDTMEDLQQWNSSTNSP